MPLVLKYLQGYQPDILCLQETKCRDSEFPFAPLRDLGYQTIEAGDASSGLDHLQSGTKIDLLLTDVILPGGLNGRQLADAARAGRPDLKVLFMTGYMHNATLGNDRLESGMDLITKPFTVDALAQRVQAMVEEGAR